MHYSAGLGALIAFAAATPLPRQGSLWYVARFLLDGAGALFLLYLLCGVLLAIYGVRMRRRQRVVGARARGWAGDTK